MAFRSLSSYFELMDNDSEYSEALDAFRLGTDLDSLFGAWEIDEFLSIARMHLSIPANAPAYSMLDEFIVKAQAAMGRALQAPYAY